MHFDVIINNLPLIASGITLTLLITVLSILLGMVLGTLTAVARMSAIAPLQWLAKAYVDLIRNTPALVQLFLVFLGIAELGIRIDAVPAIVIALGVNNGAYLGEIIRGGLQSVRKGQLEAAAALGLSAFVTFFDVVQPQALRAIYPALANQFIQTLLASSLGSVIGSPELTSQILFIDSRSFRTIELLAFLALTYAALTYVISLLARIAGRRLNRAY